MACPGAAAQGGVIVAYQGAPGAFGHQAAELAFPDAQHAGCAAFADVVRSVEEGKADAGVLPVANHYARKVEGVAELIEASSVEVEWMFDLPVRLHLLGLPGMTLADVRAVISHPMALKQCRASLARLGLRTMEASNTAVAAQSLVDLTTAALASEQAATQYDLSVLMRDLQDDPDNRTTFALIRRA